jgi:hypothetical protein
MRGRDHLVLFGLSVSVACVALVAYTPPAHACGCLSPPLPEGVGEEQYAVNQSAEQIIFEVEPGWVTAHVLIRYAGDPASFAWIVPVPEAPELGISPAAAFGLIDQMTAPDVTVAPENICPISTWSCRYHDRPSCGGGGIGCGGAASSGDDGDDGDDGAGFGDGAPSPGDPPVTVLGEEVVGDYQTVTFSASEAQAAVEWLRTNGFIVNQTTSIYMESYVQANMVFVAAKLVPGASVDAIKPLRMRYRAAFPQVPLVLTAVAAEPHLTVTSFIYGSTPFTTQGRPVVTIAEDRIALDGGGRLNYPMVLARTIDEAGGDGFAMEYRGYATRPAFGEGTFCCDTGGWDSCGIGNNQQCECPRDEFDRTDCEGIGDLVDGIALVDALDDRHAWVTRLTTRISPEEMTFDPTFEPDFSSPGPTGALVVRGTQPTLTSCANAVVDGDRYAEIDARQDCAAVYCGPGGACALTAAGAGCACGPDFVAQRFIDLDGRPSVTCVPEVPTCDLRAGGDVLPDACAGVQCGLGTCLDRNGVAVCDCDAGAAAVTGVATSPRCDAITASTLSRGAEDFSEPLRDLAVCAPRPPTCGQYGWLVNTGSPRPGVACGDSEPSPWQTIPPPRPTCGDGGCGVSDGNGVTGGSLLLSWIALCVILVRRRRTA